MLQSFLFKVKDHRRCQGRRYQLGPILLFSVWAILGHATSYRQVPAFITSHYATRDATFDLNWKRLPAYTTVRAIIQGTSAAELEQSFREYSAFLASSATAKRFVAFDGKVLRGSFDHFQDPKAIQVLSAFLADQCIILAHEEIARKANEIPTAQALITALGLANCIFTFDAIHCQEKTPGSRSRDRERCDCAGERQSKDLIRGLSNPGDDAGAGGHLSRGHHQGP